MLPYVSHQDNPIPVTKFYLLQTLLYQAIYCTLVIKHLVKFVLAFIYDLYKHLLR